MYSAPVFVFSFFPPSPNPTVTTMNWAVVLFGGVIILATVYYVMWGRKLYSPPQETLERFVARSKEMDSEVSESGIAESVTGDEKQSW
jgi:hypothetical protein